MYLIVSQDNSIVRIVNVPLFGNKVEMMACFYHENDALRTLFELEKQGLTGHHIENIGARFSVEPEEEEA